MSFTRTESERLARLKGCTTGIYCRYGRPTGGGVTGPTGPAGYSFFTLGGNQGSLTAGTGSMIVVNMNGPTGTVSYSNILQAVGTTGPVGSPLSFLQVGSDIIPSTNNIYSIGNNNLRFKNAYFGSDGVYIGNTHIGATGDTLILPSNVRLGSINGPLLGATGPTGPGGSGGGPDGGMQWINTNLLGPAPQIVIDDIVVRSSEIFIGWTYPTQQHLTFVDIWVPAINSFSAELTYNTTSTQSQKFLNNQTTQEFVDYKRTATLPPITGIILTNVDTDTGYKRYGIWHDGNQRPLYRYYHSDFKSLNPSVQPVIKLWYSNFSSTTSEGTAVLNVFISAGPPGPPRNLQGSASSSTQGTLTFNHPQWVDICDNKSTATITSYKILYDTSGSSRRYPEPYAQSTLTFTKSITTYNHEDSLSQLMQNLYPDSPYRFTVSAINSANREGVGAITSFTTNPMSNIGRFNPAPTLASPVYTGTIKRVFGNLDVTGKLLNIPADGTININNFKLPIQYVDTRGSTASQLMRLTSSFQRENTQTTYSVNTIYGGYPAPTGPLSDVSADGVIIYTDTIEDFNKTEAAKQGFFLTTDNRISVIMDGRVIPSPDKYTLSIKHEYMDGSGTVITNPQPATYTIDMYYDTPPSLLSFNDISVNIIGGDFIQVCGVWVLGPIGKLYTKVKIAGFNENYFYRSPFLEYFNNNNKSLINTSEIDLSNVNTNINNNKLSGEIEVLRGTNIESSIILTNTSDSFSKSCTIQFRTYNLDKQTESPPYSIPVIIDTPSYNLIQSNNYPKFVQEFINISQSGEVGLIGCRISSGVSRGLSGETTNIYVPAFDYDTRLFSNNDDISSNEELQIFNGKFRSKGTTIDGYINYNGYKYNNVNYSNIDTSGYRFASFKWVFKPFSNSLGVTKIAFILHDTEGISIDTLYNTAKVGTRNLLLYYRFIEEPNKTPTNYGSLTTCWADGNYQLDGLDSGTYIKFPDNSGVVGGLFDSPIRSGNNLIFNIRLHTVITKELRLICRIGLPMELDSAFKFIEARALIE